MSWLGVTALVLGAWTIASLVIGLPLAGTIRRRERQRPAPHAQCSTEREPNSADPEAPPDDAAQPGPARNGRRAPSVEAAHLRRLRRAASAVSAAQTELTDAIAAARRNGLSWSAINTVLDPPRAADPTAPGDNASPTVLGEESEHPRPAD